MEGTSYWTKDYFLNRTLGHDVDVETIIKGSLDKAAEYESTGQIDDLSNIQGAPVYIMSGKFDDTVPRKF